MVDTTGDWTFGKWYENRETAAKQLKGWETSGKVGEYSPHTRRASKNITQRLRQSNSSKLKVLRGEGVNLETCFRNIVSSVRSAEPLSHAIASPATTSAAAQYFSELRLKRVQASVNQVGCLDELAHSLSLPDGKNHNAFQSQNSGKRFKISPIKRRRRLKKLLPFNILKENGVSRNEAKSYSQPVRPPSKMHKVYPSKEEDISSASTMKPQKYGTKSSIKLFSSLAESFMKKESKLKSDVNLTVCHTSPHTRESPEGKSNVLPRSRFSSEVVSRVHGFLAEQQIGRLIEATGYSRFQLYAHFIRFKALCTLSMSPEGVDRKIFGSAVPSLSMEDKLFLDRIFDVVDTEHRGLLDWPNYIKTMSALEQGTPETRTAFLFQVYDTGGNGGISREELRHFFVSSLRTKMDSFVEGVADIFVDGVFSRVNVNEKGDLTLPEAMRYIKDTEGVTDLHGMFGRSMAMQGFESIINGNAEDGQETQRQKQARKIRKLRRETGQNTSLQVKTPAKNGNNQVTEVSHHAAQLIQAASKLEGSEFNEGVHEKTSEADKDSDLAKMHLAISQASFMSKQAQRRRASVIFLPKGKGDAAPQVKLKPLGRYHSKVGTNGSYIIA